MSGPPKITLWKHSGIPVRLDATFLLVPLFFFGFGSASRFGEGVTAVTFGTAGIFLSILLHEMGHAYAAKRYQVGVNEIVVGGFFGYAALKRQAVPRWMLIRILAAGPCANLAIFLVIWLSLALAASPAVGFTVLVEPVGQAMGWTGESLRILAIVNLAMFIFNMLPAFPLDGGRILGLILDRRVSAENSRRLVAGLSIMIGGAAIFIGFGLSLFLAIIGFMIVAMNLRRLRRDRRHRKT